MLKVFLAEDEYVVREGIKRNISWEKEGLEFVGEAGDGETAFPMIKKTKPDILITDIKMPFMDGLELSKITKRKFPEIKILILTGHNEFEYAKDAIHIGITDYLLKPISSEKLLEAIKNVALLIEKEKKEKELLQYYQQEIKENQKIEKLKFWNTLISEAMPAAEILDRAENLGMDLSAAAYTVISFYITKMQDSEQYSPELAQAAEKIEALFEKSKNMFLFNKGTEGWIILLRAESAELLTKTTQSCCSLLKNIMHNTQDIDYFAGIGSTVYRVSDIVQSYHTSNKVFIYRYFMGMNRFVFHNELNDIQVYLKNNEDDIALLNPAPFERSCITNFLNNGIKEDIEIFVDEYFSTAVNEGLKSVLYRQYVLTEIYLCVLSFIKKLGFEKQVLGEQCQDLNRIANHIYEQEEFTKYVKNIMKAGIFVRDKAVRSKYGSLIEKAKEYICSNYQNADISLNTAAANVNFSPSHFSTIFSQETGFTFVEYLTNLRMEKASELLMCSNMKILQIGYETGYRDSHYFSYIFKKAFGCSPKEYRLRRKNYIDEEAETEDFH